jgi:hypothetical protein
MTLKEQFPDVSMRIREKKKLDVNYKAVELFKDIQYNPITLDQKFYDNEFRKWHYKVLIYLGFLFTALYYFVLHGKSIYTWITS